MHVKVHKPKNPFFFSKFHIFWHLLTNLKNIKQTKSKEIFFNKLKKWLNKIKYIEVISNIQV